MAEKRAAPKPKKGPAKKTATKRAPPAKKAVTPKTPAAEPTAPLPAPAGAPAPAVAAGTEVCPRCGTATFGPEQRIRAEGNRTVRYTILVCGRGHTFAHAVTKA